MREPFLLLVGYRRPGELLAKAFDALGQPPVVIDESSRLVLPRPRARRPGAPVRPVVLTGGRRAIVEMIYSAGALVSDRARRGSGTL